MQMSVPIPDTNDVLDLAPINDGTSYAGRITRRRGDVPNSGPRSLRRVRKKTPWTSVRFEGPRDCSLMVLLLVQLDFESGSEVARTFTKEVDQGVRSCRCARVAFAFGLRSATALNIGKL